MDAMVNLINKVVNAYKAFLNNLNWGNSKQDYRMLYNATLLLKNDIQDYKYVQYFSNNLISKKLITIPESTYIYWKVGATAEWITIVTPRDYIYYITVPPIMGNNYVYIAFPKTATFSLAGFSFLETLGDDYNVFRSDSLITTTAGITYKIPLTL